MGTARFWPTLVAVPAINSGLIPWPPRHGRCGPRTVKFSCVQSSGKYFESFVCINVIRGRSGPGRMHQLLAWAEHGTGRMQQPLFLPLLGKSCPSWHSWPGTPGLALLAWHSWPGTLGLALLAWHSWPGSPGLALLAWHSWPGSPGLALLAWHSWPGTPGLALLASHGCNSHGCHSHGCNSHGCNSPGCNSPGCNSPGCNSHGCNSHGCNSHGQSAVLAHSGGGTGNKLWWCLAPPLVIGTRPHSRGRRS
jgi:hypothetical protein